MKHFYHWNRKVEILYKVLNDNPQTVTDLKYGMADYIKKRCPDILGMNTPNEQSIRNWVVELVERGFATYDFIMQGTRKISVYKKVKRNAEQESES